MRQLVEYAATAIGVIWVALMGLLIWTSQEK